MSSSESETEYESSSTGGSKIRCSESSKDYPLWSKRIMNHLMGAGLESTIIPSDETKTTTPSAKAIEKGQRINRKAYTFIYARLHDNVLVELSPEVSNLATPNAMALWKELGEKYGGGAMHELVATIDVVLTTRVAEGEDPRDKLNDMRNAFLKLNANSIPIDDTFFALIILKALPETFAATIQVIFAQPDLSSAKVITSACNYWNMRMKTKEDESTVAFTARKNLNKSTNRNTGFVNSNPPGTFHCMYHPGANSHNTVDCRKAKQLAQSNGRNTQFPNSATANVATIEDVMSYATAYIAGQGNLGRQTEFHLDSGASGHLTSDL
jgi:hypothetical protein